MIVGCEMDNKCMQMTLTEVIKSDPHPLYEAYLEQLNQNKDQIEYEQVHCNTPVIRQYRRQITTCLMGMLKSIDPKVGITNDNKEKVEDNLYSCIQQKIVQSAKQGNLYAESVLMERALKSQDEKTFNYWYNAIHRQNTTLEYTTYRECQTPLEMFDLLPLRTKNQEGS